MLELRWTKKPRWHCQTNLNIHSSNIFFAFGGPALSSLLCSKNEYYSYYLNASVARVDIT